VFDSVIVVTDRIVLDQQLQNTIYQFERRQGVRQKIDENSKQLTKRRDKRRRSILSINSLPYSTIYSKLFSWSG
jgi:type I site-specific restriction-modification system R (restriction) subunit